MNDIVIAGLIVIAALAVLGLGIRVVIKLKGGKNVSNKLKDVEIGGDYTGRDKKL